MGIFVAKSSDDPVFAGINARQEQALLLLASGYPQSFTAKQVGVNRRTIYKWMNLDSNFVGCYNNLRERLYKQSLERVGTIGNLALDRLAELIQSADEQVSLDAVKFALHASRLTYME